MQEVLGSIPCHHLTSHLNIHMLSPHSMAAQVAHMKGGVRLNKEIHHLPIASAFETISNLTQPINYLLLGD